MRIDIATLFPDMCETVLNESIIGRARRSKKIEFSCHQIRDFSLDKHRRVDDSPYGGGMGMVMQADPVYRCVEHIRETMTSTPHIIYMSPRGEVFTQKKAKYFSENFENIIIICGHYEGLDERVIEEIVDEEISVGDYVLTGGELPALIVCDAVARMCDGVLSSSECYEEESHYSGLLEYPQYTRPEIWHDKKVPEIILSGDHEKVKKYRKEEALRVTKERRPDLYVQYVLNESD